MTIEFRYRRIKFLNDGFAMPIFPLDKQSCGLKLMQRLCSLSRLRVQRRNGSSVQRSRFDDRGRVVLRKRQRSLQFKPAGALKECTIDRAGKERVIEFYFPGETVGLYALSQHTYRYCAISIEKSTVC